MKIAIIGGGAAGLMAAATVCERGCGGETVLIEKNGSLGRKVVISGGGRCNVTTGIGDIREVLAKYTRGGKFLNSAMRRFPPEAVFEWFESRGVPLKTEADWRVFPRSNDGRDIVGVFEDLFRRAGLRPMLGRSVAGVTRADAGFRVNFTEGGPIEAAKVILAAGGQAFRQTGSTGDGYAWAESLGHRVTPLAPSLSSFETLEPWPGGVSGLSFKKAVIRTGAGREISGPFLFTHRGLSGPAVFAVSSLAAFERIDRRHPLVLEIDLFPDLSAAALLDKIRSAAAAHPRKSLVNILDFLIARSLAEVLCRETAVAAASQAAQVPKKDLARAAAWLKRVPLRVIGRGAGEEFVTAGGVDTEDVDQRTMGSKIVPGLFFAGEILNIDGFTGGFNLQSAWATGRLAGESACG